MATASASSGHLPKRRRVTQACDYCHQRSIRCRPAENDNRGRCSNCIDFSQACTRNRVVKRRGARPRQEQAQVIGHASPTQASSAISNTGATKHIASPVTCVPWSAPFVATQASVVDLVEVYVEIVYPIFPLFHRASFLRRISRAEFNHDQYLFAVTMAVCALTSARANDNALFNPVWDKESLLSTASDSFYNAAIAALPKTESPDQNLDLLRAYALLSLAAMQYGRTREMQAFLGRYHTLVAMDGLHNESNWPQGLTMIEMEERRRLVCTCNDSSRMTLMLMQLVLVHVHLRCVFMSRI